MLEAAEKAAVEQKEQIAKTKRLVDRQGRVIERLVQQNRQQATLIEDLQTECKRAKGQLVCEQEEHRKEVGHLKGGGSQLFRLSNSVIEDFSEGFKGEDLWQKIEIEKTGRDQTIDKSIKSFLGDSTNSLSDSSLRSRKSLDANDSMLQEGTRIIKDIQEKFKEVHRRSHSILDNILEALHRRVALAQHSIKHPD